MNPISQTIKNLFKIRKAEHEPNINDLQHDLWMERKNSRHNRLMANRDKRIELMGRHHEIFINENLSFEEKQKQMPALSFEIDKLTVEMHEILNEPK